MGHCCLLQQTSILTRADRTEGPGESIGAIVAYQRSIGVQRVRGLFAAHQALQCG